MKQELNMSLSDARIAIIGYGFVGKAVSSGFPDCIQSIVDPVDQKFAHYKSAKDINPKEYDAIFICVPTPMGDDGEMDATILNEVLSELSWANYHDSFSNRSPLVVIKSTITPAVVRTSCDTITLFGRPVINPEFLTERSANFDFAHPDFHIMGGSEDACIRLKNFYEDYSICDPCPTHFMSAEEASMTKYMLNCFGAMKITFFNQMRDACEYDGMNFNRVMKAVGSSPRVGHEYSKVPGFDGRRGFGGACFPKDISAIVKSYPDFTLLRECGIINDAYRGAYDTVLDREAQQNIKYKE